MTTVCKKANQEKQISSGPLSFKEAETVWTKPPLFSQANDSLSCPLVKLASSFEEEKTPNRRVKKLSGQWIYTYTDLDLRVFDWQITFILF